MLSVGQFRPEKGHALQLDAFSLFLSKHKPKKQVKLILVGSTRNPDDEQRVESLRQQAQTLGIEVSFLAYFESIEICGICG